MTAKSNKFSWVNFLNEHDIDGLYLSSFDHFLSEYVPASDSLRVFLTGFTGSVAEALVLKDGKINLYVDGRYHDQADIECDINLINIVKVPYGTSLQEALEEDLVSLKKVGLFSQRTAQRMRESYRSLEFVSIDEGEFSELVGFVRGNFSGDFWEVTYEKSGVHLNEKWQRVLGEEEAAFICATDAVAWSCGLRSNAIPNQGTFHAVALLSRNGVSLFADGPWYDSLKKFENDMRKIYRIEDFSEVAKNFTDIETLWWDGEHTSCYFYDLIGNSFSKDQIKKHSGYHREWMCFKSDEEQEAFRESFEKSSQAIYDGMKWLIEESRSGSKVSEVAFKEQIEKQYKKQGALGQSFRTISGFGAHSAIIHFGSPENDTYVQEGEFVLCDSGAIYPEGFATDCTRTIIPLGKPTNEQVKHYTLVLKGLLQLLMCEFKKGTIGKELDILARKALKENNLNYAHGTGHGVGVNVHEGGYSVTPLSELPILARSVGSLEPGFYSPGVGGIRLENIAIVQERDESTLYFEDLVSIGFWEPLIDRDLLEKEEEVFLNRYEEICVQKGRSFAPFFQA